MFILELDEEERGEEEVWEDGGVDLENSEESALQPQVSVHALDDTSDYRTMRVKGDVKGKIVHVLIDFGSTHNFLDLEIAKKLGYKLRSIPFFVVVVAYGSKVHSSIMTCGVTWNMQGAAFKAYMLVISLGGTDVVLRIQWLITSGYIRWNFKQLKVEFQIGGKKVLLRGNQPRSFEMLANIKIQKVISITSQINSMKMAFIQPMETSSLQTSEEAPSPKDL